MVGKEKRKTLGSCFQHSQFFVSVEIAYFPNKERRKNGGPEIFILSFL